MSSLRNALGPRADCLRPRVPPRPTFRLEPSSACCRWGGCPCVQTFYFPCPLRDGGSTPCRPVHRPSTPGVFEGVGGRGVRRPHRGRQASPDRCQERAVRPDGSLSGGLSAASKRQVSRGTNGSGTSTSTRTRTSTPPPSTPSRPESRSVKAHHYASSATPEPANPTCSSVSAPPRPSKATGSNTPSPPGS